MSKRRVRLGVIGLGRAFTLMLPTLIGDSRIELVAACDPREEAREQFARDFSALVYENAEELAANELVEAIYVASPHQFHALHTRIAASYGKHVLVEKPMALSLTECDEMIDACRSARVHLIVGHCHSFDSPYLHARANIESGEFGRVRMIHALNYTDFLYRPRRPEELKTEAGGGVVFSQAAHQVDVVRMLAGSRVTHVRAVVGAWDAGRPTEGAYSALLRFEDGVFASLVYSGFAHFDSDEWCNWTSEMGQPKKADEYGEARRRLASVQSSQEEARQKAASTYGGSAYHQPPRERGNRAPRRHQHFGPIIVSCEHADIRPLPDALMVYGSDRRERRPLPLATVPRFEVIDELYAAILDGQRPLHDGPWAKATLEICLAMLQSAREGRDVAVEHQVAGKVVRRP